MRHGLARFRSIKSSSAPARTRWSAIPCTWRSASIFTFTSLALGSFWALIPALLLPVALAARIGNEEQLLRRDLPGYEEYSQKVKYRLLPFVW